MDENSKVHNSLDLFPTENFNVIISSDHHYFDITDRRSKELAIENDAEIIRESARAFNSSTGWFLGDIGNLRSTANLIDSSGIDEAVLVKGDEDKKRGNPNRDVGWAFQNQEPEDFLESDALIRKAEELSISGIGEYEILLDHYPGKTETGNSRNFEYGWFADDLYYQRSENLYPTTFSEPKVAITGHNHAPYVRQLSSSIALNSGAMGLNYNSSEALPDNNLYAVSFNEDEVHVALIEAESGKIREYDQFKLKNGNFEHQNIFSDTEQHFPEERFRNESIPDEYINELTIGVERISPRITND